MLRTINRWILRVCGWRIDHPFPDIDRCVIVAAPHTSNWDFIWFVFAHWALGIRVHWLGKHTIFVGPVGWIFRRMGGVSVDRTSSQDLVSQLAAELNRAPKMLLALAPEGTRSHVDHWHSGFYHVARAADVPLVLASLDYPRKMVGIGPVIELTGDVAADMDRLRSYYADKVGCRPDCKGPVRLRSEGSES